MKIAEYEKVILEILNEKDGISYTDILRELNERDILLNEKRIVRAINNLEDIHDKIIILCSENGWIHFSKMIKLQKIRDNLYRIQYGSDQILIPPQELLNLQELITKQQLKHD